MTFDQYEGLNPSFAEACRRADAKRQNGKFDDAGPDKLPFIDIAAWDGAPVPSREWAVPDRFPLRQPALLSGEGAVGKTILLLQLCVAHVLGRDWVGALPTPGPALYLGAEDDDDELHRRLADIAAHHGARFADLSPDLHMLSFAGKDAILGTPNRNGIIEPTPLFKRLHEAAQKIRPKLIGLDTSADIFAGNENDRAQVRQFVALLRRLGIDANASVLVCSHPSLTGINSGSGLSGSTGWHNSVRARAYFKAAVTEAGEEPDPNLRELQFMKNNYSPIADRVLLRWCNGVFVPAPAVGSIEKLAAERKAEEVFLLLLQRFNRQERNVNDKKGTSYAPALFSDEPEAKTDKLKNEALASAMRRLFVANKIHVEPYGRPSRPASRLIFGPQN
jgi:RecA-family ATPase